MRFGLRSVIALTALCALLSIAGGLTRPNSPPRDARLTASPGTPPPSGVREAAIGAEPHRRGISGTLIDASPSGMTLDTDGAQVFVRFVGDTRFCRRGCEATWHDLRPGDEITASAVLEPGEPVRVADWVDANVTAGYGVVVAVHDTELAVVLSRPGRPAKQRILLVEPYTAIHGRDDALKATDIGVGDSFYFTGSSDTPDASKVWVYGFWGDF